MKRSTSLAAGALLLALLGAAGYYLWFRAKPPAAEPVTQAPWPAEPPAAAPAAAPASAPVVPLIQYPMPAASAAASEPLPDAAQSDAYFERLLTDWLGQKKVRRFIQLDGFARRVVATVDNLGREHAPAMMWPVQPTPGRFVVQATGGGNVISPDNGQRYTPLVLLVESIDPAKAVALYTRAYPLLQQTYEEMGFPRGYFNDRLIAVIDQLLATPVPDGPLRVELVQVKGPFASERPWVRYQFSQPELEALSAGQKMLIRTGPVNQRRLQARLREIRRLLVGAGVPAPAASAAASTR